VWEGLAARLEGRLVVLEPLAPAHEDGLYEAAQDMDWSWMFLNASRDREGFHRYFQEALANAASGEEVRPAGAELS